MSSLNEIAYSVINKVRPNLSDDDDISLDEIKWEIHNQRALHLRNELNRMRTIDNDYEQLLCAELEVADRSICPIELPVNCTILRTKKEIPDAIELHHKSAYNDIGPLDNLGKSFSFVDYKQARFSGNGRYNKNYTFVFYFNNRMYLFSNDKDREYLKYMRVVGIFEDPEVAAEFSLPSGDPCYSHDNEYPVKKWLIPRIQGEIIKKLFPLVELPVDNSNDAKSNPLPQGK